ASPAEANQAYAWLRHAATLRAQVKQTAPVTVRLNLALAAASKAQPDFGPARRLAADASALAKSGYPPRLTLAHTLARDPTPQGRQGALDQYLEAVELGQKGATEEKAVELYGAALEPALRLGEQVLGKDAGPEVKKRVARLYADLGQLLEENRYAGWGFT